MKKLCAYLMAVLFVSCGFAFGQDNSFSYTDFSDISDLTFVRSAGTRDNKLDLNGNGGNTVGAVWTKDKYPVADGFRTSYTFQIGAQTGGGSDGIWFYVQNRAADAVSASGYANSPAGGTQLDNNYFYVGIDTYRNPGWDPNNWHLEWGYAGLGTAVSNLNSTPLPDTKNSNVHTITIDYNATAKRFTAFYDDTLIIEADLDLESITSLDNGTAYLGWQGVCGGPAESHEILSWNFNQETEDPPAQDLNKGLVAYYPFNGNANDESGNGNNLTTEGQPSYIDGVDGKAILFDGVDDAALTPRLISDNGFTWTGWFELLSLGNQNNFISQSNETIKSSPVLYYRNNESVYFYNYTSRGHSVEYKTDLPTKEWTHISIVCENNGAKKLYINGILKSENTSSFGFGELNDNFKLGGGRRSDGFSNIQIDELRVYDRPISGDEVAELYKLRTAAPEYQIIEGNFTWQEAKADAETKGGRLAVLDTQAKIDAANAFIQPDDPGVWIGLTDEAQEGLWKWITGEPLTVSNWYEGEPNNLGNEDYATIWSDTLAWNDAQGSNTGAYLLEILDQTPAVPFVAIDPLYESPSGESITLDATPTVGFPTEFTYQWCFNGFKIPANLGGTASSINIDNLQANEGTWSVTVTNSEGIFEQDFEYRLYVDSDTDGLSDGYEEIISKTEINNPDTDNDGLVDGDEVNVYSTNPNSTDSDSDGFTDLYELETAYDPNSAESVPDALVNIMTAIEVKFNAALGATYAIEFSTDNQNWDVIEDDIVGEGGAVERLYSKQNFPTGFFRVERRDQ
ncbi:hypothetical protein N9050_09175 [Akkermansiaceae bacterium]|nr:hypothetical protein [Akkermansiaceae bacterium]